MTGKPDVQSIIYLQEHYIVMLTALCRIVNKKYPESIRDDATGVS